MLFDPNNRVVKLCAEGVSIEGLKNEHALMLYEQAWNEAETAVEKFIAAHYVARLQKDVAGKLKWDETALMYALNIHDENIKGCYPSLYLNIAKCYEDLAGIEQARKHYELGYSFTSFLPDDEYGKMIKSGIVTGLERVK